MTWCESRQGLADAPTDQGDAARRGEDFPKHRVGRLIGVHRVGWGIGVHRVEVSC
jgi:hypothetical protein